MLQVNPVLSDNVASPQSANNINVSGVDSRRYTKFDRSASEVQTADNFSFSDLLDTLNPLQHIPVISSAYRAIAGEDIHPAARVAGDIIYGGAGGIASGIISVASATGDSLMESQTGHDATGHIVLAMLGEDGKQDAPQETASPVMVADANMAAQQQIQQTPQAMIPQATTQPSATSQPPMPRPVMPRSMPTWQNTQLATASQNHSAAPAVPPAGIVPANTAPVDAAPTLAAADISSSDTATDKAPLLDLNPKPALKPLREDKTFALADRGVARAFPLNPNKLPYGGVMAPLPTATVNAASTSPTGAKTPVADAIARMDAAIKQQNRLISLVQNGHDMRSSTTVETNPAMPGNHPILNTPTQTLTQTLAQPQPVAPKPAPALAATVDMTATGTSGGNVHDWGQDDRGLSGGFTNDALLLRALGQYQNTISRSPASGGRVDVMN